MNTVIAIIVDGLVYASWLFLVAVGMTLVCGVMKILNVAHGALYAFGAYTTASMVGVWFAQGWAPAASFVIFPIAAVVVGVSLGLLMERGILRLFYGRDEVILVLVTFALFLMFEDALQLIWGPEPQAAYQPYSVPGLLDLGDLLFSLYDLSLLGVAAASGIGVWAMVNRTIWGRLLRAVIHDREMAVSMGINVTQFYTVTFIIGATLGAFGGAVTAPMISVQLGIGVEVIILAFAVVVIGGMGSIGGALLGAVMVGIAHAAAVHLMPKLELFVIYLLMTLVLSFRPEGLFAPAAARKI